MDTMDEIYRKRWPVGVSDKHYWTFIESDIDGQRTLILPQDEYVELAHTVAEAMREACLPAVHGVDRIVCNVGQLCLF